MGIYEQACRVIDEAGQAGGIDEVRRISERGWPSDVDGAPASPELLTAIQDRARTIVAEVAQSRRVAVRIWGPIRDANAETFGEWDPDALAPSNYVTARARELYDVLGVPTDDTLHTLCLARDGSGRWALVGKVAHGHEWAVEVRS